MDDPEIGGLIKTLLNDPNMLTEDEVNKLAKHPLINQYSIINNDIEKVNDAGEVVRKQAFFSYSNLQEDYMRRFEMTSLVGFLYRMYKEYEPDVKTRTFKDMKRVDPKGLDKISTAEYDIPKIEGMLKKVNNMVTELKVVSEMIEKINYKFLSLEIEDKKPSPEELKTLEEIKRSHTAIMFAITQTFIDYGQDANRRIHTVLDECRKHKDIVDEINKSGFSLPPAPEDVIIPVDTAKEIIHNFLNEHFEYDPDKHVKSALDDKLDAFITVDGLHVEDSTRPSTTLLKARCTLNPNDPLTPTLTHILNDRESYNASMYMLRNQPLLKELAYNADACLLKLLPVREAVELLDHIPPADTFHRWNYYAEVNMEEIRSVVRAIYHEKPEFEFMLNIYDVVEGTEKEIEAKRKRFAAKYNEELSSDFHDATLGKWAFLSNYKKNRDNIDFYNRHTEVLKRIMDQHEQDKKLGKDLMGKRVKKQKAKNIEENGKDAEILAEYKKQITDLSTLGATRVLNAEEKKAIEEARKAIKDLEEVKDVPDDAIQVNVFTHDTQKGEFVKGAFYTEAEKPPTQEQIEETLRINKK